MGGLSKICKMYGSIKVNDVEWVYDYAKDKPVLKSDMTEKDFRESEKAKWAMDCRGLLCNGRRNDGDSQ